MKQNYHVPEASVVEIEASLVLCQSGQTTEIFGVYVTSYDDDDFD